MPAASINFGPFGGVGMAAAYADSMRSIGLHPLPPSDAHAAFQAAGYAPKLVRARIARSQFARVNTTKGPWPFLDQLSQVMTSAPAHPALGTAPGAVSLAAVPAAGTTGAGSEPKQAAMTLQDVAQLVQAAASEVLGQDIGQDGHFAAGHFDSLAAVELANALGKTAGRELPGTLVFDYPSVASLARHLHGLMQPVQAQPPALPRDQAITAQSIGRAQPPRQYSGLIRVAIAARLPHAAGAGGLVCSDAITTAPSSR